MRITLALAINVLILVLTFLFMSHMYIAILIAISLLVWFFYFLWRRQQLVQERVERKIAGQKVIMPTEHIMLRALESSGYSQASGMGYIALTEDFLYFELILLDLVIAVPTARLQGVEFVRRLKGVSPVRKMLRIMFINENGEDDSIAVNVKEMEHWKNAISDICKKP
ncbi:hypothetical protein [Thalassomonas actiniarum]|uniref:Uncharacterized protein n=1 Tax=Thalassomonas actiniarum TaxID=485447 RepID=A0AAE9YWJ4_9GAMM|nr:hypothetical protein [Thalassomonas actiniarum]WDE01684.1 hypothetical protein SG35_014265 [Thalassomonas actiniarum]